MSVSQAESLVGGVLAGGYFVGMRALDEITGSVADAAYTASRYQAAVNRGRQLARANIAARQARDAEIAVASRAILEWNIKAYNDSLKKR